MLNFIKKIIRLKNSRNIHNFIAHNYVYFGDEEKCKNTSNDVILFELNNMQSPHIAYSYMASILRKKYKAKLVAYKPNEHENKWSQVTFKIKKIFNIEEFGVFRSFGVTDFIEILLTQSQKDKAFNLYENIYNNLNQKCDVENITINGIWLGDLIYDTYLRLFNRPTIIIKSNEFKKYLQKEMALFVFWQDFFKKHNVKAINVSHCAYNLAIPMRIALSRNIPAYQSNVAFIYRLNKNNCFAYSDFRYFPKQFSTLPESIKLAGLAEAKARIDKRFAGAVGVDMEYSSKSAYTNKRYDNLIKNTSRKKILIATHCFYDSPHSYGNNIFPDFYEWLDFLGKITEVSNYDWYIKTHPDYLPGTKEVIDGIVLKYPKFNLLPADSSHHQIISEGINFVLTVYGTIGFEYAALGIPVINCSVNNPHISYNFNLHPRDQQEYHNLLMNLDGIEFDIDKNQVYEYYFMRHIYNTFNLFFNDYDCTIKSLGGDAGQFSDEVYKKWLSEITPSKHKTIITSIEKFILSEDFRMGYKHLNCDFTL